VQAVSHDFLGEALAIVRFNVLTGDSTGTFEVGDYTTAVPLVQSPWVVLGNVSVLLGGTLRFQTGMDMQLIGTANLQVAGTFVAKDGSAPAITTMNGTCDFLAGSLCQTESMALCGNPAYLSQNAGAGQLCEPLIKCATPLFREANSEPGEMCTLPVAAYPAWTHVFKSINVLGGRVTLPGDSRVLLDGEITVTTRGMIRVESGIHIYGKSLTCGNPDSLMQSTIEWFGVGQLIMSEAVTINVPCLVDGTGRGHEIKTGNGSATTDQQGGTHAGFGGGLDWDSGFIGGTRGYGDFFRPITMGSGGGGARGGAAIYIEAPVVVVEGAIRMNGGDAERTARVATHGGGAGGSIWIELTASSQCQGYVVRGDDLVLTSMAGRITGNGSLSVVGGGGYHGGGGGRISIMQGYNLAKYDTDTSGDVSLSELQDTLRARFTGVWNPEDGSIDAQINAKIFLKFDLDGSGRLDLDEFANFYEEYERIEFPGTTLAHGGDAWAGLWDDGITYKTGVCQNTGGVVVPANGAPWTQCANIAGATWSVGAGHGWSGGAGTVVYTRLTFENRLGISFTRMSSPPSTIIVHNHGRWNTWTTVIFNYYMVILDVDKFYIEGGAQATFGTRAIIVTDMKVTVNNFLGGSYPWSRIYIPSNMELTITGADASMPEMQQYTTTTPMSGAFQYTRAEVTLTRVYYLADLGMSGFDFDTAEDADSGAITLPERLNVMNSHFSLRRVCKSGLKYLNVGWKGYTTFYNLASTDGRGPNTFVFQTLSVLDGGALTFYAHDTGFPAVVQAHTLSIGNGYDADQSVVSRIICFGNVKFMISAEFIVDYTGVLDGEGNGDGGAGSDIFIAACIHTSTNSSNDRCATINGGINTYGSDGANNGGKLEINATTVRGIGFISCGIMEVWFGWAAWDALYPLDHSVSDLNIVVQTNGLLQHGHEYLDPEEVGNTCSCDERNQLRVDIEKKSDINLALSRELHEKKIELLDLEALKRLAEVTLYDLQQEAPVQYFEEYGFWPAMGGGSGDCDAVYIKGALAEEWAADASIAATWNMYAWHAPRTLIPLTVRIQFNLRIFVNIHVAVHVNVFTAAYMREKWFESRLRLQNRIVGDIRFRDVVPPTFLGGPETIRPWYRASDLQWTVPSFENVEVKRKYEWRSCTSVPNCTDPSTNATESMENYTYIDSATNVTVWTWRARFVVGYYFFRPVICSFPSRDPVSTDLFVQTFNDELTDGGNLTGRDVNATYQDNLYNFTLTPRFTRQKISLAVELSGKVSSTYKIPVTLEFEVPTNRSLRLPFNKTEQIGTKRVFWNVTIPEWHMINTSISWRQRHNVTHLMWNSTVSSLGTPNSTASSQVISVTNATMSDYDGNVSVTNATMSDYDGNASAACPLGTSTIDIDFNSGQDAYGNGQGKLLFTGKRGFAVYFTNSDNANGVEITNQGSGNCHASGGSCNAESSGFVLGANDDPSSDPTAGTDAHTSAILAVFNQGATKVSFVDTSDDQAPKTVWAYDANGTTIGEAQYASQQIAMMDTNATNGSLIYALKFASTQQTAFTVDNFHAEGLCHETQVARNALAPCNQSCGADEYVSGCIGDESLGTCTSCAASACPAGSVRVGCGGAFGAGRCLAYWTTHSWHNYTRWDMVNTTYNRTELRHEDVAVYGNVTHYKTVACTSTNKEGCERALPSLVGADVEKSLVMHFKGAFHKATMMRDLSAPHSTWSGHLWTLNETIRDLYQANRTAWCSELKRTFKMHLNASDMMSSANTTTNATMNATIIFATNGTNATNGTRRRLNHVSPNEEYLIYSGLKGDPWQQRVESQSGNILHHVHCGLPQVVQSVNKADNIQSRQEHIRLGVRQYLLSWGACVDCVVQVADDRSIYYEDNGDVQNTRFIVSVLLWRHTISTTLLARFHGFAGTTGILNSVYTYLQDNAVSITSTREFYSPVAYVPIRCVIRLGFNRQLTAGLSRVVVIRRALTVRIHHEIPACAARPDLCTIRVVPLGTSSDSWTVSNSYARRYESVPEGVLTTATRFSVQIWSTTDTALHDRLYALFEDLKMNTGTALRDFRRQILEEVNGPIEIKFDEFDSPFFGKQGISGWLEHGIYDDASSLRTTTRRYLCIRRTESAFVFDRDSESYQYNITSTASSSSPAAALFVFDSRQDYLNFFAFGQANQSLVRYSVDARDILDVRELTDPRTGFMVIELEIVLSYGSNGGVGSSRVVVLQASSAAQRAQWFRALSGFVPAYPYRVLSCGVIPHSVNGLGVLDIMNQRKDEIYAGISIRSSTVSYRYDARFLQSRALSIVFNISSNHNFTQHGDPALTPINITNLKSSLHAFFGEFGENVIAAGHGIQLQRVVGGTSSGMLSFHGKIFTFEHSMSCAGLGSALLEEYGIVVLHSNKTCAKKSVWESNFTSQRESIRTRVHLHLRNAICAADHVMNSSCGLWNDNAVGVTYSAASHHISVFVRAVHSWTASRLLRELPVAGTSVLRLTTGLKPMALHEGTDVLVILAWKLEYFARSYLDFSTSNMRSWTLQPVQGRVYSIFFRREDGSAEWLGALTSTGGYSFAVSVDFDVSGLTPQNEIWIRRLATCKWHGRKLLKPGNANTMASLNVGCRHRTRVAVHFELSNLQFGAISSHVDIRTLIRNSAYDRLCDQYQCAVRVDIVRRSSVGSPVAGGSVNGSVSGRSGDYVVRLTVWSPTSFVADYMRNHMHHLTGCHSWLRLGIGIGPRARCVDFGMGAAGKHVSTLAVVDLLPTASITELLWDTRDNLGEFKQTDSLKSDFRFSCASHHQGYLEEDPDENGNGNEAENRSNASNASIENESSEVCMFSYRIIKLSAGDPVSGGVANGSGALLGEDSYEDCLMMAANATDDNNMTASALSHCGVARNASGNATAPTALTTGQRWLSVHDGQLQVFNGTAEQITIFDACLLGVVKPSLNCTPALGPGRYRLEVLASYADDPEYEQDAAKPTTFEWLIRKDLSEEITSVLVDTAADSLDNMDDDMTCEEMNKIVNSMGTFMNRTSCAPDMDPAAVYEKRENEMNLVMNALNAYAPRILGLKGRYDRRLNSVGHFNDPSLFYFNDYDRPLTQRTAQNRVILTSELKNGEISMQNHDEMFVEYRLSRPLGSVIPVDGQGEGVGNNDDGNDDDGNEEEVRVMKGISVEGLFGAGTTSEGERDETATEPRTSTSTTMTTAVATALSGCDWIRCNVSDPGSPCKETWTDAKGSNCSKLIDGGYRLDCSMTIMQVEIDIRVDGLYSAQVRLTRDPGGNTSVTLSTPTHLLQSVSWEADHESPRVTLALCDVGDCYTESDSPIKFGTAVYHAESPRGVSTGNTTDMIYYVVVGNGQDRDVVDYRFAGKEKNDAIAHGEAKVCLDQGSLYRDPSSAPKDSIWKRRKPRVSCFNVSGAFHTVNANVCNGTFIETNNEDPSLGFRCDRWGVNRHGNRMFRIRVPVHVNAFALDTSLPKRTLERRLEVSLADEAGNGNKTSVSWYQTVTTGDPNPKKVGNLTYKFIDHCTMSVRWIAAANLDFDEDKGQNYSVINARGIPPTSGHMIWWTQSDRSNARKTKGLVGGLTEGNILSLRSRRTNLFVGPDYENTSRWVDYVNFTSDAAVASDPELFGANANTNGDLQRGVHAAVYTDPLSRFSAEIWSVPLTYSATTSFVLRTQQPVWDKATFFSIAALSPRANDGSKPLKPQVLKPEDAVAWTIVEDCMDSNDYLDASGPMFCPYIPGTFGRKRMRDRECEKREWQCRECVPGADCTGPVVWPAVGVKDGHWRSFWDESIFLPCDEPDACLGRIGAQQRSCDAPNNTIMYGKCNHELGYTELCAKPFPAASATSLATAPIPPLKQCNLCTRCRWGDSAGAGGLSTPRDSRFTRSFGSISKCEKCWTEPMHAWFAVLISFAFCTVTGWYVRNNRRTGYRSNNKLLHKALQIKGKTGGVEAVAMDERAKYKLALVAQMNKCIITVTFAGSLSLRWHPAARSMFSIYKVLTLFVGDLLHLDCLDPFVYEEAFPFVFKEAIFWLLAFVGIVTIFSGISLLFSCSKKGRRINTVATVLATVETLYPTVCQKVFGLVACRWVGDRRFMLYDHDVECYADARHRHFVAAIAAPATIAIIVFVPLLQCLYTRAQRRNTHQNLVGRVFYRLMTVGLRPEHYLWRTMEKLETALVVFVLVFTSQYGPFLHAFAYASIVIFTSGLEVYCDPYRTIRVKKELSEKERIGRKSDRAAFDKSEQTHANVFQIMKNRSVSVSLFNVFLGALSLGEDRHQQWRSKWWVSWETLQTMVAVTMILGNMAFMFWVVHLVYSQFGWYQGLRDCLCCRRAKQKKDRTVLKVTPELRKRQEHVGRNIVRRLSQGSAEHSESELAKYRSTDHHDQGKALLDAAHRTAIVPNEEKVIEAVIQAGERFELSAARKSKLFAKLKVEAQKARERVAAQKKRRSAKLKKVDSIANDGLFSSTGYRRQSKKGRKARPPGRGVAKSNLEELRRRKAERLATGAKIEKAAAVETETSLDSSKNARVSRMPGPDTGGGDSGGADPVTASILPVSELRNWKVEKKTGRKAAEGSKVGGEGGGATALNSSSEPSAAARKGETKRTKRKSSVMARAKAAKAEAEVVKTPVKGGETVIDVSDKGAKTAKRGDDEGSVGKGKAGAVPVTKANAEKDKVTRPPATESAKSATTAKASAATAKASPATAKASEQKKEKATTSTAVAAATDPKLVKKGKGGGAKVENVKSKDEIQIEKAETNKAKTGTAVTKADKRKSARAAKQERIAAVKSGAGAKKM
jgi:hypothetical protein